MKTHRVFLNILFFLNCLIFTFSVKAQTYKSPGELFREFTLTIPANLQEPYETEIQLEDNEYIFIEAIGKIHVGESFKFADATGLLESSFRTLFSNIYNKYPFNHGSLVAYTPSDTISCLKIFKDVGLKYNNIPGTPDYDPVKITEVNNGFDYIPGVYFISKGSGKLYFDINDNEPDNNSGAFYVKVRTIKFQDHINRNFFNRCPVKEPDAEIDCNLNVWMKENRIKSSIFHGISSTAYRGLEKNAGFQCVYKDEHTIVEDHKHQGSFDIGYWLFNGEFESPQANYYHLILDVIPHDLFAEKYEANPEQSYYILSGIISCN